MLLWEITTWIAVGGIVAAWRTGAFGAGRTAPRPASIALIVLAAVLGGLLGRVDARAVPGAFSYGAVVFAALLSALVPLERARRPARRA